MPKRGNTNLENDRVVVYASTEDQCWVAHSLRTDQIGVGDSIVEAVVDLVRAVKNLMESAVKDDRVQVCHEAPPEIQELADSAEELPRSIIDVVTQRVHGPWPKNWPPNVQNIPTRKRAAYFHELRGDLLRT